MPARRLRSGRNISPLQLFRGPTDATWCHARENCLEGNQHRHRLRPFDGHRRPGHHLGPGAMCTGQEDDQQQDDRTNAGHSAKVTNPDQLTSSVEKKKVTKEYSHP